MNRPVCGVCGVRGVRAVLATLPLVVIPVTDAARGAEVVAAIEWTAADAARLGGSIVDGAEGAPAIRLTHEGPGPRSFALATIDSPGIRTDRYAVTGQVRYENAADGSYLEMWSVFADGGRFFSRTLGTSGPLETIAGSSPWRGFALPAFLEGRPERPTRLELSLVLTGPAVVEMGPLTLTVFDPGENVVDLLSGDYWWSERTGGLIGGLGGAALGLAAAALGVLVGWGRARGLVTGLALVLLTAGVATLAAGIFSVFPGGQPYSVYYPLLLLGTLTAGTMTVLLVAARLRFRALELRRMRALDAS